MRKGLQVVGLAIIFAGCKSGDAGGAGGTAGTMPGSAGAGGSGAGGSTGGAGGGASSCNWAQGTMTWLANGVPKCAASGFASRVIGTGANELLIVGVTGQNNEGYVIDIDTMTDTPPRGTYVCNPEGGVMPYVYGGIPPVTLTNECRITVDEAGRPEGPNARGTFSGSYRLLDDSTLEITNGAFDLLPNTPPP